MHERIFSIALAPKSLLFHNGRARHETCIHTCYEDSPRAPGMASNLVPQGRYDESQLRLAHREIGVVPSACLPA